MSRRVVYRVKPSGAGWRLTLPERGGGSRFFFRKTDAVAKARFFARARWEERVEPAQLVVHKRNGRVQYERTYGRDPRRHVG